MDHQSLALGVWLGIAVLALIWAIVNLWRARHLLSQLRKGVLVPESRLASSAVADKTSLVLAP